MPPRHNTFIITLAFYCCCIFRSVVDPKTTTTTDVCLTIHFHVIFMSRNFRRSSLLSALVLFKSENSQVWRNVCIQLLPKWLCLTRFRFTCARMFVYACVWRLFVYKIYTYIPNIRSSFPTDHSILLFNSNTKYTESAFHLFLFCFCVLFHSYTLNTRLLLW